MRQFQLESEFHPAGDQPEAIEALLNGIEVGELYQTLLGVTGSGKTFTMAHLIASTSRTTLILAPNKTLAAQLYAEMRDFFPGNAVEYFVSYYDYYQPEAYVPSSDPILKKMPLSTITSTRCVYRPQRRFWSGKIQSSLPRFLQFMALGIQRPITG